MVTRKAENKLSNGTAAHIIEIRGAQLSGIENFCSEMAPEYSLAKKSSNQLSCDPVHP